MDKKKVGMRERGGGRVPPQLRGLALLLSVFLFVFSFLPINAYALDGAGSGAPSGGAAQNTFSWKAYKADGSVIHEYVGAGGWSSTTIKQKELDKFSITFDYYGKYSSDKLLGLEIPFRAARYKNFKATLSIYDYSDGQQYLSGYSYNINFDTDNSDYSYKKKGDYNTLTFKNLELKSDISSHLHIYIVVSDIEYVGASSGDANLYLGFNAPYLSQTDKSDGFFNNIIGWLKDIVNKIKELPQAIGSFITSLGDRISSFFTNLTNNLKTRFDNIGKWFTDLGNNIKQWFIDITNNIKNFFNTLGDRISGFFTTIWNNTVEFFTRLFKPSDDYFDNLSKDLDNHMSEHLGAVYNVPNALIVQLTTIVNGLKGADSNHLYIAIPEFAFRLKGEKKVILEAQQFDVLSSINAIEEGSTKAIVNTALIIMHGMIDLALAVGCFRMIYKKIINKVGIEGGDDL